MHINSKKYPLHVSKEIEQVLTELKQITQTDHAFIQLKSNEQLLLSIVDKDSSSGFYFNILHANINRKKQVVFAVQFLPGNSYSTVATAMELSGEALVQKLNWWMDCIADYNLINTNLQQWETVFTTVAEDITFELLDTDAGTQPYNSNQQQLIEQLLENIATLLEERKAAAGVPELLQETNSIGQMLATATKTVVAAKLISLFKKLAAIGMELIKEVIKLSAAELIQLGFKAV